MDLAVALDLSAIRLADDEAGLINSHLQALSQYRTKNLLRQAYYEGSARIQDLGIAMPPALKDRVSMAVGWPGTTVDVLEERLDWLGWTSDTGDTYGLDEVAAENTLDVDMGLAILDALIFGTSFVRLWSSQTMAGRSGLPCRSRLMTVPRCVVTATPRIADFGMFDCAHSRRHAVQSACQ